MQRPFDNSNTLPSVAILSAGPSLVETFSPTLRDRFDLLIGVNAAAAMFPVDQWACGDAQTFARVVPLAGPSGPPVLFTITDSDNNFTPVRKRLAQHELLLWGHVNTALMHRPGPNPPACWTNWSLTAAIGLAVYRDATQIDIFGHDATGIVDIFGHELAKRAENWRRVESDLAEVRRWALEQRGIATVMRQPTLQEVA